MRKNDIDIFLENLKSISIALDKLSAENEDLYLQYTGNLFEGQKELSENILDNLILSLTHEVASEINFSVETIKTLTDFITFRKTYFYLSDKELEDIIDSNINTNYKLILKKKIPSTTNIVSLIKSIQKEWTHYFGHSTYKKIKQRIYQNHNA